MPNEYKNRQNGLKNTSITDIFCVNLLLFFLFFLPFWVEVLLVKVHIVMSGVNKGPWGQLPLFQNQIYFFPSLSQPNTHTDTISSGK